MSRLSVAERSESPYERRLVARFQAGEAEALGTLFEMHVDRLFAFAHRILGNREDAEEITSEAFLRAFERAASFRGESPFRGWLFGIARNLCYDRLRQPRLLMLDPSGAEIASGSADIANQVVTSVTVRTALAALPEEQRIALLLCDVDEWNAAEAAQALDRSVAATKSLLYRARRALRDLLKEAAASEEDGRAL